MNDANETLDPIYARLSLANSIDLDANVARHYRRDVPKLLSAVENVLALCERADASDSRGMTAIYTDSVRKAITDALAGGE